MEDPTAFSSAEIMNWTGHALTGPRTKLVQRPLHEQLTADGVLVPDASGGSALRARSVVFKGLQIGAEVDATVPDRVMCKLISLYL